MTEEDERSASSRAAPAPHHLQRQDWKLILRRVGRQIGENRLMQMSAGVAFFAVLSIAPVLVTALSVYGAVNTPQEASQQLESVSRMLPTQVERIMNDQLTSIVAATTQVTTLHGITALLLALWTATTAMATLMDTLTLVYHERETRSFPRRIGIALAFVLGGALLLGAVIAFAGALAAPVADAPEIVRFVVPIAAWAALAALMSAVLAILYRLAPDRKNARWEWTSWGATAATLVWLGTSVALFAYVQRLGTYESTYGSLAGVAISMFWLWITVLLVVIGAAVNAESERQTTADSTVGPAKPPGERGAVVADDVPPYPEDS